MGINSDMKGPGEQHVNGLATAPSTKSNTLRIIDNRTGKEFVVPIVRNSVSAVAFRQMKAPGDADYPCDQTEYGIRVYDPGYQNTAVSESKIAYK
jgi:citrate synthase